MSIFLGRASPDLVSDHCHVMHGITYECLSMACAWSSFRSLQRFCREISAYYKETTGSGQLTPVLRLLAGAGAGIVAMSATYPLDMVRGRLTVQEGKKGQYQGIIHAARVITAEVSSES